MPERQAMAARLLSVTAGLRTASAVALPDKATAPQKHGHVNGQHRQPFG
jgi:hypothetical protein